MFIVLNLILALTILMATPLRSQKAYSYPNKMSLDLKLKTDTSTPAPIVPAPDLSASAPDLSASAPDLSYDGFQLLIEDLTSEGISRDCQYRFKDFLEFKRLQNVNFEKFSENLKLVQDVFTNWTIKLRPFLNQKVTFAKETFGPLKTLIEGLNQTAAQMEKNSIVADDLAFELSEFLASCESMDQNWLLAFDDYYTNLMTTQSELWRYYIESSQLLAKQYEKLKEFEGEEPRVFTENDLNLIQKLANAESGSSGFGEMRNLYLLVIDVFYIPELDKLEKKLEESKNVESRSMH